MQTLCPLSYIEQVKHKAHVQKRKNVYICIYITERAQMHLFQCIKKN